MRLEDFGSWGSLVRARDAWNRGIAGALAVAAATLPAQAIDVYIMSSGDATLDASVQTLLAANGHTATIGEEFWEFDGTQSLAGFDAVYMQVNYNSAAGDMPAGGQLALVEHLYGGGGLVTTEWTVYQAADDSFLTLQSFLPVEAFPPAPGFDSRLPGIDPLTLEEVTNDPVLAAGLPTSFSFATDTSSGGVLTDCFLRTSRPNAVQFYQARTPGNFTTSGLAGVDVGGGGRVMCINAIGGPNELADANFSQLLINSLVWAASPGTTLGTDLAVLVNAPPACTSLADPIDYAVRTWNIGSDTSGPVTLTVDLPHASVATYTTAMPVPTMVTPTMLTFDLGPMEGGELALVSIELTAVGSGTASLSATASTTGDMDLANNSATGSTELVYDEIGDAPELDGGQIAGGTGPLTAIEGRLDGVEADMYRVRVDDWATFSATTANNPTCMTDSPRGDTAVFLFDVTGAGIAFNEDGCGARGCLEAGNPLYANRTNGELVLLAVAPYDYDPMSDGLAMWNDSPFGTTRAPDGPGASGVVDGWAGTGGEGTYRLEMTGVVGGLVSGIDLVASVGFSSASCVFPGHPVTCSVVVLNAGADTSGAATLTVELPPETVAAYTSATPAPSSVTPTTLTFDLSPIVSGGRAAVSIELLAVAPGTAAVSATASTTTDVDFSNNSAATSASIPSGHREIGDAPELDGGQIAGDTGPLTVIEGELDGVEADMYRVRIDDWATFSATTANDPTCTTDSPRNNTAVFLFDAVGAGIAFNEDGCGVRGCLEAGNPLYANRTNGEIVLLAVAPGRQYDPTAGGLEIWNDTPVGTTRAPDGPGASGVVDGWAGSGAGGTYRLEMTGVVGGLVSGIDLVAGVGISFASCTFSGQPLTCSVVVLNAGADTSGPATLTVELPPETVAAYTSATPAPSSVTPTTLTFDLSPIVSGGRAAVSIELLAVAPGTAAVSATASTTTDVDLSNNSAATSASIPSGHREIGDAPELDGGQIAGGTGPLTVIEGRLDGVEADMYRVRVDDWSTFSATTANDPTCTTDSPRNDTAVFLFDVTGAGIAFNEDGCGVRGCLEAGNPLYANRTNGEIVLLAVGPYNYNPTSGGLEMWNDGPFGTTRAPDGPGASGVVDGWAGSGAGGTYRLEMTGVLAVQDCPADLDGSTTVDVFDLLAYLDLWFTGDAAADIDGAAGVDVFDLLAYLDTWFAGC